MTPGLKSPKRNTSVTSENWPTTKPLMVTIISVDPTSRGSMYLVPLFLSHCKGLQFQIAIVWMVCMCMCTCAHAHTCGIQYSTLVQWHHLLTLLFTVAATCSLASM